MAPTRFSLAFAWRHYDLDRRVRSMVILVKEEIPGPGGQPGDLASSLSGDIGAGFAGDGEMFAIKLIPIRLLDKNHDAGR